MAEIGKVTPGSPIITRVPREHPPAQEKEPQQEQPEQEPPEQDNKEQQEDENNHHDKDGGIDLYV